jgi:hypothetical protein
MGASGATSRVFGAGLLMMLAGMATVDAGGLPPGLALQGSAGRAPRQLTADLVIRHRRVDANGQAVGPTVPERTMRITRHFDRGQWSTTLQTDPSPDASIERPEGPVRLANPFAVHRLSVSDTDEGAVVGGPQGNRPLMAPDGSGLVPVPLPPAVHRFRGHVSPAPFVADIADASDRREALLRRFGPPRERRAGLDHYIEESPAGTVELLVMPDEAVPVEIKSRGPNLPSVTTTVSYEARPGLGLVQRLLTTAVTLPGQAGTAIVDLELRNVVLSTEGAR